LPANSVVSAIALQICSSGALANTAIYPAGSLPYQVGKVLLSYVTPALLVLGIIVYAIANLPIREAGEEVRAVV